jgi:succinoglycan biosynthesis transport protein ExoP
MSTITPPGIPGIRPTTPRSIDARQRGARATSVATTIDPVRVLRRHWVEIMFSAFIGGVLGVAAFFIFSRYYPLYSSTVYFEIQPGLQESKDLGTVDLSNDEMVFRVAQTEAYLLTSREVLNTALKNPDVTTTKWYEEFKVTNSDGSISYNIEEALDDLSDDISASPMRGSNLFVLRWSTSVPEDVPTVLNAIADSYIKTRKARDEDIYNRNYDLFNNQLARTQRDLEGLTQETKRLIKAGKLTSLEDVNRSAESYRHQQLTEQLAEAASRYTIMQTSYKLTSAKLEGRLEPSADDVAEAQRDPVMMDQSQAEMAVKTEYRRLIENGLLPTAPMVVQMESRVRAIEAQSQAKLKEVIKRDLEGRARLLSDEVEKMRSTVEQLEDDIEKNMLVMQQMAADQSEYEAKKIQREHLEAQRAANLELINEVQLMRMRSDAQRVRLTLRALPPREASFPKKEVVVPLAVLVVMGLTVGFVFLRELMDQRVKSTSDLAVIPGAYVLGGIPEMEEDPTKTSAAELVVRKHPLSVLAETYRQAATMLGTAIDRTGHQTMMLVGGMPGSGTTTAATNLAAAFAAMGRKVCVVDANFRRPRLARAMEVPEDGPGLGDLLSGLATLDDVLIDAGGNISVIPAGTPANRVIDRFNNGAFDSVLAELRGRFDLVIFDTPPAVVAGDAMLLANKVDAAVLLVRAHQEHRGLVARMINRLSDSRCELLGVLLNRPRGTAGGYLKKNYAVMAEYTAGNGA